MQASDNTSCCFLSYKVSQQKFLCLTTFYPLLPFSPLFTSSLFFSSLLFFTSPSSSATIEEVVKNLVTSLGSNKIEGSLLFLSSHPPPIIILSLPLCLFFLHLMNHQ